MCNRIIPYLVAFLCAVFTNQTVAYADVCAGLPQTGLLCRIAAAGDVATEVLPARAIGAISAFVASKIHGEDPAAGAIERRLFSLVPEPARGMCRNAARDLQNPQLGEAILCIRPVCLSSAAPQSCKSIIASFSPKDVAALRSVSQGLIKDCSKPESCSISAAAVELAIAAEQLRPFAVSQVDSPTWSSFCPENSVPICSKRLADLAEQYVRRYSNAAAWHLAINQLNTSKGTWAAGLLASREVKQFEDAWAEIQKTIDRRSGDAAADDLFPLSSEMQGRIKNIAAVTEGLSVFVNSLIIDERIHVTNQLIADSRIFLQAAGALDLLDKDLKSRFEQLPQQPVTRQDSDWRAKESLARELATAVQTIQQKIVSKVRGDSLSQAQNSCAAGSRRIDPNAGVLEFCYPPAKDSSGLQIVGLKFRFVPCTAPLRKCDTKGDFQLLWRLNNTVVARPLGLDVFSSTINTGVDIASVAPIVVLKNQAPAFSFNHLDDVTLATIREILPAPISLTLVRSDVIDGPEARFEFIAGLDFEGLRSLRTFQLRLSRDGATLDGVSSQDILRQVQLKLLEAVEGARIKYGPFEVTLKKGTVATECPNAFGFILPGNVTLPNGIRTAVELNSCGQRLALEIPSIEASLRVQLASTLNSALGAVPTIKSAQVEESTVKIYASNNELRLLAGVRIGECQTVLDFNLSGSFTEQLTGGLAAKIVKCILADQLKNAPVLFKLGELAFKKTDKEGVFCTEKETPIGRLCVSGVKEPYNDFDKAELQSDGEAFRKLTNGLREKFHDTIVVKELKLSKSRVVALMDFTLPFLGKLNDLTFTISNS